MGATRDTQTRKVGDTLRLSGELTGATIPTADADWVGATAVINIVEDTTARTAYRTAGAVTLSVASTPRRYSYAGSPPAVGDIGTYLYEIVVTFADATITSFPDSDDKYRLRIVAQLA
jgi:hypothetical protein